MPPANNGRNRMPLRQVFVALTICHCALPVLALSLDRELAVAGGNELRFASGYDISHDLPRPWNYFTNTTDLRVEILTFYLKTRFDVEEPSLGYDPPEPVFREYFSRRTLGFASDHYCIETGHITTQFGRGLTLSLKEDREIEQYALLDGVYGQIRFPWLTVQGVGGRPLERLNRPVALLDVSGWGTPDTLLVLDGADMRMRDMVAGVYAETFFPVEKAVFSFLSSGSVGGGFVRYNTDVGPLSPAFGDTVMLEKPFWYQNRRSFYLPSVSMNLLRDGFGLAIENAWMAGTVCRYVNSMDSARGAFDSVFTTPTGFSTYISVTASVSGVSLLAEFKNYFFGRTDAFSEEVSSLLVPPSARCRYSWHLLNKQVLSNLMADALGYNFSLSASPNPSAIMNVDFSFGGQHDTASDLQIRHGSGYWELYAEWVQDIGEWLDVKAGFDVGKLDPQRQQVTFRTLACDIEAGPFGRGHAFGLIIESQLNDKLFLAEKNITALKNLIGRTVFPDSLTPGIDPSTGGVVNRDTLLYDDLVPDDKRSKYRQYAFNLLATFSYHFSSWLSLSLTLEHEKVLEEQENLHSVTDIGSKNLNYASLGMSLKPAPRHTILLEFGSMSGGRKCSLGTCVDLPMFKGFKCTVTSTL